MTTAAAVQARLDVVEDELAAALALLDSAVPAVWRSPAAGAYRDRLDELGDQLRRLLLVCRGARPEVAHALAQPAPEDPLFKPWLW